MVGVFIKVIFRADLLHRSSRESLDFKHFFNIFKYFFHARLNTLLKLWPISPSFLQVLYFLVGRCIYQSNFSRWPIAFSPLESVLKTNLHPVFYSSMGTINMAPYTAIFGELSANEKTALYLLPIIYPPSAEQQGKPFRIIVTHTP